jgi:hypothetical protein
MRTQACACGVRHPVLVVLMGAPVVECPEVRGRALHLEQMAEFPNSWFLRVGPEETPKRRKP